MEIVAPDAGGSVLVRMDSTRQVGGGEGRVESMDDTGGDRVAKVSG
jgi:hypothetical protein